MLYCLPYRVTLYVQYTGATLWECVLLSQVDSPPLPPVDPSLVAELQAQVQAQFRYLAAKSRRVSRDGVGGGAGEVDTIRDRLSSLCAYVVLSGLLQSEQFGLIMDVLLLQVVELECMRSGREELKLLAKKEIVSTMVKPGIQQSMNVSIE